MNEIKDTPTQPYTRTSDEVGILKIIPDGAHEERFIFCVVDVPSGADYKQNGDISFATIEDGSGNYGELTYNLIYDGDPPPPDSPLQTIALPFYISTGHKHIQVVNVQLPDGTTKTGSAQQIKTSNLPMISSGTTVAVQTTTPSMGQVRALIINSQTNTNQYFVIGMVLTDGDSNELQITTMEENGQLNLLASQVNYDPGNRTAAGFIDSSNGQYGTIQSNIQNTDPVQLFYGIATPL